MMSGEATPSQMGGLLMALRVRGETVDEITGAVTAMRARMLGVTAPADAVDIVGTGGDGSGSVNVSTCASFVAAGAGVTIAKHGNRALSSKSGAADVLAALGVKIELTPDQVGRCIREAGIGFMFAPAHHPAMRNVGPTRVELATRTIFNLLGPLSNPAGVKRQMIGVFSRQWVQPLAEVLKNLGAEFDLGRARLRRPRRDHADRADRRLRAGERQDPQSRGYTGGRGPAARQWRRAERRRCGRERSRPAQRARRQDRAPIATWRC